MKIDKYKDCPCRTCIERPCQFIDYLKDARCQDYREWERKKNRERKVGEVWYENR